MTDNNRQRMTDTKEDHNGGDSQQRTTADDNDNGGLLLRSSLLPPSLPPALLRGPVSLAFHSWHHVCQAQRMISTFANMFFFIVAIASTVVDVPSCVATLQSGKHECCNDRAIRVLTIAVVETCIPAVTKGVLVVAMRLPTPKRVAMWTNPCASLDRVHCLDGQHSCSYFVRVRGLKPLLLTPHAAAY